MEIPHIGESHHLDRAFQPSAIPGNEPLRRDHRYGCRRLNPAFLERIPQVGRAERPKWQQHVLKYGAALRQAMIHSYYLY